MSRVLIAGAGNKREMPLRTLLDAGHEVGVIEHPDNIDASGARHWWRESLVRVIDSGQIEDVLAIGWDCFTVWGEYALDQLSRLRAMTEIPGPDLVPEFVRDKVSMRSRIADRPVLQPRQATCRKIEDVEKFQHSFGSHGVVVKPRGGSGSSRVRYVAPHEDSRTAVMKAGLVGFAEFLCEEFIAGREFSCELLVLDGECHVYGTTEKFVTDRPWFYEVAEMFPAQLAPDDEALVNQMVTEVATALRVCNASMHIEFKASATGIYLIEAAGRLAGDDIPLLVRRIARINPYLAEIDWYVHGRRPKVSAPWRPGDPRAFNLTIDKFPTRKMTPAIEPFLRALAAESVEIRKFDTLCDVSVGDSRRVAMATGLTHATSEQMREVVRSATEGL